MGALAIGLFIGVAIEYFIDAGLMHDLQRENQILRDKVIQQDKQLKKAHKVETIEIVDRTTPKNDVKFGGF